jgi:hypothetical protein
MAITAQRDQEKRTVEVNRLQLVETLKLNLKKHVAEYDEAMAGYKDLLLSGIDDAFADAKKKLEDKYIKTKEKVASFTDADIAKQQDFVTLVEDVTIQMKVPRSYAKEYEAAIDMAEWDVRETLELTHAEFTCFVRDQWDWKSGFEAVSNLYKNSMR